MRQPQNAKRGRGRGRRGNANNHHNHVPNRNTSYESNGPDVKLRGNAQQLHEKYMALAHDAASAGERISAEAFTQFADHYFRLHQAAVGVAETKRQQDQSGPAASAGAVEAEQNGSANSSASVDDSQDSDGSVQTTGSGESVGVALDDNTGEPSDPSSPQRRTNGKTNASSPDAPTETMSPAQLAEAVQDKAAAS